MKALIAFTLVIFASGFANAGIICSIKGSEIKAGVKKAPLIGAVIYLENSSSQLAVNGLESYAITSRPSLRSFEAKDKNYFSKIDFITKTLIVNNKLASGKIDRREFEIKNCRKDK